MEGKLSDNCIECKMSHGIPPVSERSGLRDLLEGNGVHRRFSLLLPTLPQVNSSGDVGLEARSVAEVARDNYSVDPQLIGELGLDTHLPPDKDADFQQAEKWQALQDLDPRLLNQPEPNRRQSRRCSDNVELGAPKGLDDTRTTCQRQRAATVAYDAGHDVTQSNSGGIETRMDPDDGARLIITQEMGGSDRIRSIFEQLNGKADIHGHITNASKQGSPVAEVFNIDPTLLLENKQESGLDTTATGISGRPRPSVYSGDLKAEGSRADSPYEHDFVGVASKDPITTTGSPSTIGRGRKRSRVETKDAESVDNTKEASKVKALKKKEVGKRKRSRAA